jgi:hypothetical protein
MLILHRQKVTATAVMGELSLDGSHYAWTLERPYTDPEHPCIPVGTYPVFVGFSGHFQRDMVHIDPVPGRAGILIHGGNHAADSLGCVLIGRNRNTATEEIDTCADLVDGLIALIERHPGQIQVIDDTTLDPA